MTLDLLLNSATTFLARRRPVNLLVVVPSTSPGFCSTRWLYHSSSLLALPAFLLLRPSSSSSIQGCLAPSIVVLEAELQHQIVYAHFLDWQLSSRCSCGLCQCLRLLLILPS